MCTVQANPVPTGTVVASRLRTDQSIYMPNNRLDRRENGTGDHYRALLAVSEAIVAHHDLSALVQELAGQLRLVVQFDGLSLVLHDEASNLMRLHILKTSDPLPSQPVLAFPVESDPAGWVWQTQQPLITSNWTDLKRWPEFRERMQPFGVQSLCWLPLTTSRRRLGALFFLCQVLVFEGNWGCVSTRWTAAFSIVSKKRCAHTSVWGSVEEIVFV